MTQTAEMPANTVKITDAGPCLKTIAIEVPAAVVDARLRESMDALAQDVQLPGFRKGHVPRSLVERKFGPGVKAEAKNQLVSQAYSKAIEDHKIRVLGDPFSETIGAVEIQEGKPLAFELQVEVLPEIELPSLEGIAVKKPVLEITDKMVDDEITKILINEGTLESRDTAEAGDYVTGHGIMKAADGTEFYNLKGAVVQIPAADKKGQGMILGVTVEDFGKQFGLPKPGETATLKVKGPANHEVERIRNQDLTITFTAERVDRIIPASVADIVKNFGHESEQSLRDTIRTRMKQRVQIQQQVAMRQQIAQHLIKSVKMELPKRLTAQQSARSLERRRLELMYRGIEPQKIEENISLLRAASSEQATNELKLLFILTKAAEQLKVQVNEAEINGRIAQMAQENNVRPEKLRQDLIQSRQIGGVFQQIREHKVLDAVLAKATVADVSAEDYEKSMKESATAVM